MECSKREGGKKCIWYSDKCINPNVSSEIKRVCDGRLSRSNETQESIPDKSLKMIKEYKGVPAIYIVIVMIIAIAYGWFMPKPITDLRSFWTLSLIVVIGFIAMIIVHELLHGILFKIFTGKVTFGFLPKKLAFYASSPQSIITKEHFIAICLFPQILAIPCFIVALVNKNPLIIYTVLTIFVFNLLGGVSDWWVAFTLAHYKQDIMVEDTKYGMPVYENK